MTDVQLAPVRLAGAVDAPPSKSYTHRALVLGYLSGGPFCVERPLDSDDTRATARGLGALGASIRWGRRRWTIAPRPAVSRTARTVRCGASGSTLRFLVSVAAREASTTRFVGVPRLGLRPIDGLLDALRGLGATAERGPGGWPLTVRGPLRAGSVRVDASASSQFLSGLLLVAPTLRGSSRIVVTGRAVSAPYVSATRATLRAAGVRVRRRGREFLVPGPQSIRIDSFVVPGDASGAAYLWAGAALTGGRVTVRGIDRRWPQADLAVLPLLRLYGARVRARGADITVEGATRRPFSVDLTDAPDLYPLAGVLAAAAGGRSRLRGAAQVVHKESDRRAGTARLARALGARVRSGPGGALEVEGRPAIRRLDLRNLTDHRMLMSAAVAGLAADGPSRLGPRAAVGKSFPGFWRALARLGAKGVTG